MTRLTVAGLFQYKVSFQLGDGADDDEDGAAQRTAAVDVPAEATGAVVFRVQVGYKEAAKLPVFTVFCIRIIGNLQIINWLYSSDSSLATSQVFRIDNTKTQL